MTRDSEQTERDLRLARLMEAVDEMLRVVSTAAAAWQGRPSRWRSKLGRVGTRPGTVRPAGHPVARYRDERPNRSHRRRAGTVYFKPESAEVS